MSTSSGNGVGVGEAVDAVVDATAAVEPSRELEEAKIDVDENTAVEEENAVTLEEDVGCTSEAVPLACLARNLGSAVAVERLAAVSDREARLLVKVAVPVELPTRLEAVDDEAKVRELVVRVEVTGRA